MVANVQTVDVKKISDPACRRLYDELVATGQMKKVGTPLKTPTIQEVRGALKDHIRVMQA